LLVIPAKAGIAPCSCLEAKALTSFAVESRAARESLFFERQRGDFQQPEGLVNPAFGLHAFKSLDPRFRGDDEGNHSPPT
jgi:hypothetical protein